MPNVKFTIQCHSVPNQKKIQNIPVELELELELELNNVIQNMHSVKKHLDVHETCVESVMHCDA
jgi:hypothetical protein